MLVLHEGMLFAALQGMLVLVNGLLVQCTGVSLTAWGSHITGQGGEGACTRECLCDMQECLLQTRMPSCQTLTVIVARHRRMLVQDNTKLISNKEIFLSYEKSIASAMQGNAHPRQSSYSTSQWGHPHAAQ